MPNYVGQTIGQYQLIQLINESDNAVYKGLQPAMNRYVAVKILGSAQSNDLAFVQQFQRDMQAISGLNHPNILPLMDYGQYNEQLYMVTPFVEGGTLRQRMAEFQTPWQVQTLITAIAAAVEQIHDRGMVHGNLKPGNILLNTQGEPLLTDFGFTQGIDTGIRENPYLSPELLQSGTLDRRSDTYALGVLLYELLTGETPVQDRLVSPRIKRPDLPVAVEQVILKALAYEPAHRYQTAAELSQALNIALPHQAPIQPTPDPPYVAPEAASPPQTTERNVSYMLLLGGLAIVLLLAICFGAWFIFGRDSGDDANVVVPTAGPSVPAVTALEDVNIRTGPGEVYDIIGVLAKGQSAETVGISPDGQWWSIKMPAASSGQGWVAGGFVTTSNTENVPVVNPPPTPTQVSGDLQPPQANINGTTRSQVGQQVQFSARNSTVAEGSHLVAFDWDFDDGSTASGVDVSHVYNEPGTYVVQLTVVDDKNLSSSTEQIVEIEDASGSGNPPVAVISAPARANVGEAITFDASQSQSDKAIVSFAWNLGDGTQANAVTIEHVYDNPGDYNVTLTVTDEEGLAGTSNVQIRVTGEEPAPTDEDPDQSQLEGVEWFLEGTLEGTSITVLFQDGTLQGNSGCNNYRAAYQLDGNNIAIDPPQTTSETCDEAITNQENLYLGTLATASNFEVTPTTLTIFGDQQLNYAR